MLLVAFASAGNAAGPIGKLMRSPLGPAAVELLAPWCDPSATQHLAEEFSLRAFTPLIGHARK
jgi:hypothetical protein